MEKGEFFQQMVLTQLDSHVQKKYYIQKLNQNEL